MQLLLSGGGDGDATVFSLLWHVSGVRDDQQRDLLYVLSPVQLLWVVILLQFYAHGEAQALSGLVLISLVQMHVTALFGSTKV